MCSASDPAISNRPGFVRFISSPRPVSSTRIGGGSDLARLCARDAISQVPAKICCANNFCTTSSCTIGANPRCWDHTRFSPVHFNDASRRCTKQSEASTQARNYASLQGAPTAVRLRRKAPYLGLWPVLHARLKDPCSASHGTAGASSVNVRSCVRESAPAPQTSIWPHELPRSPHTARQTGHIV